MTTDKYRCRDCGAMYGAGNCSACAAQAAAEELRVSRVRARLAQERKYPGTWVTGAREAMVQLHHRLVDEYDHDGAALPPQIADLAERARHEALRLAHLIERLAESE